MTACENHETAKKICLNNSPMLSINGKTWPRKAVQLSSILRMSDKQNWTLSNFLKKNNHINSINATSTKSDGSSTESQQTSKNPLDSSFPAKKPAGLNNVRHLQDIVGRFQIHRQNETRKADTKKRRRARKALKMISFILGAFVTCWTPYHVTIIVKGFCDKPADGYSCINDHLYNFAYYMCYMNSPINPFCYSLANITFRRAFLRILKGDLTRK